jgi:poly-gamma-glutamate capsule biosynthesis protein CapA/YwtB (metallophosphatase superfamily)
VAPTTFVATGDILTTRSLRPMADAREEEYQSLIDLLREADITFGNLEVCLTRGGFPAEKLVNLRADPDVAKELSEFGFDLVSIANNHALDFGFEGLEETIISLERAGIPYVGGGRDLPEALQPVTLERTSKRFAHFGFSSCLPLGAEAGEARPGIAPIRVTTAYEIDPATLLEQPGTVPVVRTVLRKSDLLMAEEAIRRAKQESDFVIIGMHWGLAYQDLLAEYQQTLAHAMIDAGADLIIGHHPHVPHGVEVYKGRTIFYSLGNFVMQYKTSAELGALLANIGINMNETKQDGEETFIAGATFDANGSIETNIIPIVIDSRGLPRRANEAEAARIVGKISGLSAGMARIILREGVGTIAAP